MPDDTSTAASEGRSAITSVTAGTNPVTGEDVYQIEYADGELQNHRDTWAEARELAHRAGLEGREDGPAGVTRWFRRGSGSVCRARAGADRWVRVATEP